MLVTHNSKTNVRQHRYNFKELVAHNSRTSVRQQEKIFKVLVSRELGTNMRFPDTFEASRVRIQGTVAGTGNIPLISV
jgi:hypothetical protein